MTFKTLAVAGCAMAAALSGATYALAQAPAAAAPPQVTHGAPVPGVCVFSGDGAIGASTVGKNVFTRLQQLTQQASAEVDRFAEGRPVKKIIVVPGRLVHVVV